MFLIAILIIIAIFCITRCVKIVEQSKAYVVERMGVYQTTLEAGVNFILPFVDRVARKVNLKEQVADFPPQAVITKDNVTMRVDSVVYFYISDPKAYTYGVENPIMALENLAATTLRNIIGTMELDESLTSRDIINTQARATLDKATDPWGIKVTRVEVKNITPPDSIREAMEKQMKAEREKRESITNAEAARKSAVLTAEGEKQAAILKAEAEKETAILAAQAEREKQIEEATGRAEAILRVKEAEAKGIKLIKQAEADGIRMIKAASADDKVIALKSLETLSNIGNGRATKIIIPSELQNVASLVASIKEVADSTGNSDEAATEDPFDNEDKGLSFGNGDDTPVDPFVDDTK